MDINAQLLDAQRNWQDELYRKVFDDYKARESENGKLSCAFSFGVSEHYMHSDKKIMIVGQEANGHSWDYAKWGFENPCGLAEFQKWAIDYLDFQLYGERRHTWSFTTNTSPFWQFFNVLKQKNYGVCWNNIDKVRRYIQKDSVAMTEDFLQENRDGDKKDRSILHKKIFDGKSLLQKEIEIAAPDIVVFAIGPEWRYYHSLCLAFFEGDEVDYRLNVCGEKYPDFKSGNYCCDISADLELKSAFYTYHPNFLRIKNIMTDVIEKICKDT